MKKVFIIFINIFMLFILVSCSKISRKIEINEVTNKVNNEITTHETVVGEINIDELDDLIQTSVLKVSQAVVGVTNKVKVTYQVSGVDIDYYDPASYGSAVIYKRIENKDDDVITSYTYYAYTNEHVISESKGLENKIFVYIQNGNLEIEAEVLGKDEKLDLAVIKFDSYLSIDPIEVGDSDAVKKGSIVFTVGNPSGYTYYGSSSLGIISNLHIMKSSDTDGDGVNDFISEYIQTDAAINPGNSGGGLFTLDGKLIGIISLKLVSSDIEGMGFSIPANIVRVACNEYLENGLEIIRPRFGITGIAVRDMVSRLMVEYSITAWPNIYDGENPYGVFVTNVGATGSLAGKGIEKGDILLKIDDIKLYSNNDISGNLNRLDHYMVGDMIELTYYCQKEEIVKTITVELKTD